MLSYKTFVFSAASLALLSCLTSSAWAGKYDINLLQTPNFEITDDDTLAPNPDKTIIISSAKKEQHSQKEIHSQLNKTRKVPLTFSLNCTKTNDISVMLSSRCLTESEENDFQDNGDEPTATSEIENYERLEEAQLEKEKERAEHKIPRISCIEKTGFSSQKNAEECLSSGGRSVFVPEDNLFKPYQSYYSDEVVHHNINIDDGETLNTPRETTSIPAYKGMLCNGVVLYPSGITHSFSDEFKNARLCISRAVKLLKMRGSQEIINLVMPNGMHNRVQCNKADKVTCKLL